MGDGGAGARMQTRHFTSSLHIQPELDTAIADVVAGLRQPHWSYSWAGTARVLGPTPPGRTATLRLEGLVGFLRGGGPVSRPMHPCVVSPTAPTTPPVVTLSAA